MASGAYTPSIRPELLRGLHRLSQATHIPMTRLLDAVLRHELRRVRTDCGEDSVVCNESMPGSHPSPLPL